MVIGILSVGLGVLVNSNYKTIGKKVIVDDYFMTIVGSLANVANGISRPIWSNLIDKYPFKRLISVILIL